MTERKLFEIRRVLNRYTEKAMEENMQINSKAGIADTVLFIIVLRSPIAFQGALKMSTAIIAYSVSCCEGGISTDHPMNETLNG